MPRALETAACAARGEFYAEQWLSRDEKDPTTGKPRYGPAMVLRDLHNLAFKDEFEIVFEAMRGELGKNAWARFEAAWKKVAEPREDAVFHDLLKKKLAITPDGEHMEGVIGTTTVGGRRIGTRIIEVEAPDSIARRKRLGLPKTAENRETRHKIVALDWPVYAGEEDERHAGSGVADPIPGPLGNAVKTFLEDESGALNTRVSNESVLLGANALVDNLDEGTLGAIIVGYTTPQATDPDTAIAAQVKLFTCTASATAFGVATDAAPGGLKTANAVTDDTSADATNTLDWCRASSSSVADTALDDHIDGKADTSGSDWTFNTVAIVAGATVSITSWTCTLPES